jgi:hypothetical protein
MRVYVCIEFEGVECNSEEADGLVEIIGESCEHMQVGFNATSCYIDEVFNDKGETE